MNMVTQFDEKGKMFTSVVSKMPIKVLIQLPTNQIRGEVHVRRDGRLKDELDSTAKYIAVTNARIFTVDGSTLLLECRFISINNSQIIWIIPDAELLLNESSQ
jgi:hypothetical protein